MIISRNRLYSPMTTKCWSMVMLPIKNICVGYILLFGYITRALLQIQAPKTAAYYISPIEIGVL